MRVYPYLVLSHGGSLVCTVTGESLGYTGGSVHTNQGMLRTLSPRSICQSLIGWELWWMAPDSFGSCSEHMHDMLSLH